MCDVTHYDVCPKCNMDFKGKDIYQYFLDKYNEEGGCTYPTTVEKILESAKNYPTLYGKLPDFGPMTQKKVIKFAKTNTYSNINSNTIVQTVNVRPGLTANGLPTTNINNTVAYANINFEDDWDYIVQITNGT